MGRPNSVLLLPDSMRSEIDSRLRAKGYGDLIALEAWTAEQGHAVGKSSLHRYATGLRSCDNQSGEAVAVRQTAIHNTQRALHHNRDRMTQGDTGRKAELLMQLGRLAFLQRQLMQELEPLMVGEPIPPCPDSGGSR